MALSGLALLGFITGHLIGNLKVLQGPDSLNAYAAWLQGHPLLWVFRLTLLAILALHVGLGISIARENRAAQPQRYSHPDAIQMRFAERHILLTGILVLAFIVYHLLHLTLGSIDPAGAAQLTDMQGRPDVYARVVLGFQNPWITGSYLLAFGVLALHLQHALRSVFQTLGFSHQSYQPTIEFIAKLLPALLALGFACIPLLVALHVVDLP